MQVSDTRWRTPGPAAAGSEEGWWGGGLRVDAEKVEGDKWGVEVSSEIIKERQPHDEFHEADSQHCNRGKCWKMFHFADSLCCVTPPRIHTYGWTWEFEKKKEKRMNQRCVKNSNSQQRILNFPVWQKVFVSCWFVFDGVFLIFDFISWVLWSCLASWKWRCSTVTLFATLLKKTNMHWCCFEWPEKSCTFCE